MTILIQVGQLVLALAILVTIHELGHFWAARIFGIKVEKFYLFFDAWGAKLFSFKRGDTEYGVGWLPLGGYVKIAGMIDESLDSEQLKRPPEPWEFRSKPAWQRLIVMLGGIIMNVILGLVIFIMMTFVYGEEHIDNTRLEAGIVPYKIGRDVGLKKGDRITEINGEKLIKFNDVYKPRTMMGETIVYTVQRGDSTIKIKMPADFLNRVIKNKGEFISWRHRFVIKRVTRGMAAEQAGFEAEDTIIAAAGIPVTYYDEFQDILAKNTEKEIDIVVKRASGTKTLKSRVNEHGKIGIETLPVGTPQIVEKYSFAESVPRGVQRCVETIRDQVKGFGVLLSGKIDPTKAVNGPIGMVKFFPPTWNWELFWNMCGLLSLVLAFMNLLPIPALDGGHVVFLLYEMIRGKPLPDKFLQVMQVIGMVILLTLMVLVFGNDIIQAAWK